MTLHHIKSIAISSGLVLLLTGCAEQIPDTPIEVSAKQLRTLEALQPIHITRATSHNLYDIRCQDRNNIGTTGYYLTANHTSMNDREAKWVCAHKMKFLTCPNMAIVSKNGQALGIDIDAKRSEYSKQDIEACVIGAIDNAPTALRATSEEIENENSWN